MHKSVDDSSASSFADLHRNILSGSLVVALVIVSVILTFLCIRHRKIIFIVCKTFPRDIRGIYRFIRTIQALRKYERANTSVGEMLDMTANKFPTKVCFQFEEEEWTFQDINRLSNQVGNYFLNQGYKKGDVVSLFMDNRPEYICIWMGLSRIGVVTSLINSNLRLQPLKHSFDVAQSKAIIYGTELASAILEVFEAELSTGNNLVPLYSMRQMKEREANEKLISLESSSLKYRSVSLDDELANVSTEAIHSPENKPDFRDSLFYIYTSGTTGLPKAAIIKHSRFALASISFHYMNSNTYAKEIIYTCLPLYHTAGGLCGVGQAVFFGDTVILRRKFSASRFWKDCHMYKVTVAQYIGEICRYLLSQQRVPEEKQHNVRSMVGNGLRPEIWKEFVERFNIPQISEIYGSTDGNCNMANFDNQVGAVGFVPILLYKLHPMGIMRVDEITGEPIRDSETGLVCRCRPNESGEFVGKIVENHPIRDFQGYAGGDIRASEKKILRNVFSKGDAVFRTGDFLVMDECGYFYFKDRAGDSFRWKGENVSTAEVESVLSNVCNLKDCVAFGVKVPGTDGRACMAVVAAQPSALDLNDFADGIYKNLPSYARPLFLRITKHIETTGTHKLKKLEFRSDGFDITKIKDPIYFYTNGKYVGLDEDLYSKIIEAKIRV